MNIITSRPETGVARPWHALTGADVFRALDTSAEGLDASEALRRLRTSGPNELPSAPHIHPLLRFVEQFNNVLIYFLLVAAVAAGVLEHFVDAGVIIAVVLVNAIVGFLQEGKADQALAAIRDMIAPHATVLRGGQRHRIDARDIVIGDVVIVEAGDKTPADLRLVRARNLVVDEAILTGESLPTAKGEEAVGVDAPLGDRASMLYSGTLIATGQANGVAVATAATTEIGRISTLIGQVRNPTTPLLSQMNHFGKLITWFAVGLAAALFAFATLLRGDPWPDALMVVVALAVGIVPEGLPAVISITLAIGVQRMARRNAVVRRLTAVETLGATSVICSDKTGTLTCNEMTVRRIVTPRGVYLVEGAGYAPEGRIEAADPDDTPAQMARADLIRAALLCSDAQLIESDVLWSVHGDPMEGALVTLAMKSGLHPETERTDWPRLDEIPFDARHRFMATLHRDPAGDAWVFVKGAPERVLAMCQTLVDDTSMDAPDWHEQIAAVGCNGERVLGFAAMRVDPATERLNFAALDQGLRFLGIAGLIDPPRAEAITAIAACRSAGIAVKMITGDHAETAGAIARQLRLSDNPSVIAGVELDALSDIEFSQIAATVSVFARASPEHKLRLVRALQANGHVVAMTGDGVNDAPSLKQADVGIAMGHKGTEAAKEAALIVLLDDNFASIVAAVREGRTVHDNIRKVIAWTLPTSGGVALGVILAIVLNRTLPMTSVQILWVNMTMAITLGLALAFEPPEPDVMRRPPRPRDEPLLSRFLIWRIWFVSVLFLAGTFGMFEYAMESGRGIPAARTMVVNTLVVMEVFYLFNVRYLNMSSFSLRGATGTPAVIVGVIVVAAAQLAFTFLPFMQTLFDTEALTIRDGALIIGVGVATVAVIEIEKSLTSRFGYLRSKREGGSGNSPGQGIGLI